MGAVDELVCEGAHGDPVRRTEGAAAARACRAAISCQKRNGAAKNFWQQKAVSCRKSICVFRANETGAEET